MLLSGHCGEIIAKTMTDHLQKQFGACKICYECYYHHYCPRNLVIKYFDFWQRGQKRKTWSNITEL